MKPLTVSLVQADAVLGDVARNLDAHLAQVRTAADAGAGLVVFPELSLTGYVLRDLTPEVALRLDDEPIRRLREASRDVDLVVGFIEECDDHHLRNSAAYLCGGEIVHVHRKVYLPTYSMFEEGRYWGPGDTVAAFDTRFGRVGILTCEDVWHLSMSYLLFADRADIILVPSASPARGITVDETAVEDGGAPTDGLLLSGSSRTWEGLLRQQSASFNVYTVYVNRVGVEDGTTFAGGSRVVGPNGRNLLELGLDAEIGTLALDPELLLRRRTAVPMLRDERLDVTLGNLERIARSRFDD